MYIKSIKVLLLLSLLGSGLIPVIIPTCFADDSDKAWHCKYIVIDDNDTPTVNTNLTYNPGVAPSGSDWMNKCAAYLMSTVNDKQVSYPASYKNKYKIQFSDKCLMYCGDLPAQCCYGLYDTIGTIPTANAVAAFVCYYGQDFGGPGTVCP